jgi:hypothetical protein
MFFGTQEGKPKSNGGVEVSIRTAFLAYKRQFENATTGTHPSPGSGAGGANGGPSEPANTGSVEPEEDVAEDPAEQPVEKRAEKTSREPAEGPQEEPMEEHVKSPGKGKAVGDMKHAHGTHFDGMGSPFGGCGVPPEKAKDDNGKPLPYVALNTNSEFDDGSNCGRWVEITVGENCVGAGNSQWDICKGGSALLSPWLHLRVMKCSVTGSWRPART